jgi:hypothetical protein
MFDGGFCGASKNTAGAGGNIAVLRNVSGQSLLHAIDVRKPRYPARHGH